VSRTSGNVSHKTWTERVSSEGGATIRVRRRNILGAGAAVAAASLGAPALHAQPAVRLDLSTVPPDGNFHTKNCRAFAEEVARVTDGAVRITVHAGGALGYSAAEHLAAVRDGLVQMAGFRDVQQASEAPLFGIEAVPFLIGSIEELAVLHRIARPAFDAVAATFNQTILYMVPSPAQCLYAKTRIDALDGFRGARIRVLDRLAGETVTALGMVAVQLPWVDTRPALASGAAAGAVTSSVSAVNGRFWEVLACLYRTNHAWDSQVVTINNDAWGKIAPAHRKAIVDLAARLQPQFWRVSVEADAAAAGRLAENGMDVVAVAPAMLAQMRGRTSHLEAAFVGRAGPVAADIIARYRKAVGRT